jgi:hypothetical protein
VTYVQRPLFGLRGRTCRFYYETPTRFGLDEYDVADQGLISHHYAERDGTFGPLSIPFRYAVAAPVLVVVSWHAQLHEIVSAQIICP